MIHDFTLSPRINSPNILWQNIMLDGTVTASSESATGLGVSALSQATNSGWVCDDPSGTLMSVGGERAANMAGFAKHTLAGLTVFVEYLVGSDWVVAASIVPANNAPFMVAFGPSDGISASSWRVRVTGGAFQIGVFCLGLALVVPGVIQIPHTPLNLCETVEIMGGNQSRSGQFLASEYSVFAGRAGLSFEVQQPRFVLEEFEAFRQWFNRGNAFFIASAGRAWPLDMGYCWRDGGEIVPPWGSAVYMDLSMDVAVYRG